MSFRAKRLRVQLPCSAEGSLVELAADGPLEPGPRPLHADWPLSQTCHYLTGLDLCVCSVIPQTQGPGPPCFDSALNSAPQALLAEQPQRLIEPDLLPLLKKQLENRLAELDLAAEVAKKRMEAHLDDIAVAEQALRDRRAQDQEPDE
jgi:hypothetical protein